MTSPIDDGHIPGIGAADGEDLDAFVGSADAGLVGVITLTHAAAQADETVKRSLAERYRDDRRAYTDANAPFLWDTVRKADHWAQKCGWVAGPSDR